MKSYLLRILDANLERLNKMNETKLSIFEEDLFIQFYVFKGHISHFSIQVDDITGFNNWIAQSGRDLLRSKLVTIFKRLKNNPRTYLQ